ncbi:MAG: XdhC family protein [Geminicoccaceae bacterium]|jgi:xanthine dehydrogenase accessory factor|nr:XdhC family protein [Geminicoccaceae bacterium]MCB9969180.1 XdhC family protein [Geminicoccaceae bacterium]HRY25977.1 XdhC/CoxI family protein [Geminicoccaceae bacterium]
MAATDVFDVIERLRATGRPFCVATVVRTADVTSAKAGAKAVVTETGELIGHLGGACVAGAVARAARSALEEGAVRLIRVKPAATVAGAVDPDGAELFKSGCPSGGTVDLLIEPYALPPLIAILGRSPVAKALATQARLLGYRVAAEVSGDSASDRFIENFDLTPLALRPTDFVVVAAQGRGDLQALRAALGAPPVYVGMVASRKKAAVLLDRLRSEGMDEARLARLDSPAGLDLGGVDPEEIALAIMAAIVRIRNRGRRATGPSGPETAGGGPDAAGKEVDPTP